MLFSLDIKQSLFSFKYKGWINEFLKAVCHKGHHLSKKNSIKIKLSIMQRTSSLSVGALKPGEDGHLHSAIYFAV